MLSPHTGGETSTKKRAGVWALAPLGLWPC